MDTELNLSVSSLYAFVLVLARVAGVFIFVPLPGMKTGPQMPRVVLAMAITFALFPLWPTINERSATVGTMIGWIIAEATLGIAVGVVVSFISEMFQMGFQMIGTQAGYSFASTIDPTSGADSTVMLTLAQTISGLLFFSMGLDRIVLLAFARSLETRPPGQFVLDANLTRLVIEAGSSIFSVGFRLVLPLMALLMMVDVAIALLSRLNSQLQLVMLAFPIKMMAALILLAGLVLIMPRLFLQAAEPVMQLVQKLLLG